MPHTLDQILPSLASLGVWSYWIIGLAAMLEAYFATGIFVPGTLIVDAGGILVQQGVLDFFDLAWFVAIGSALGGVAGYWTGVAARKGLQTRWNPQASPSYQRAERLFRRHGGLALVVGRFLGPVSGLVPFAAAVSGMQWRRFFWWNAASGIPYALAHVAFGYFLGDVVTGLGPIATRLALFAAAIALLLAVLLWLVVRIERMLPFVLSVGRSVLTAIGENPGVRAWAKRHPRTARFISGRFDTGRFSGLTATLLGGLLAYIAALWAGSVLDFVSADAIVQLDDRVANLAHAFWHPVLLSVFAHVTALGDWRVVTSLFVALIALLIAYRHVPLVAGLVAAVIGNQISVTALKAVFARPRPELAYFIEHSGSFPSGHAAISVAFYGSAFYIAWRLRLLGPLMAVVLAALVAFFLGASRIYLIVHHVSDVVNGWLIGALWMVIGIALAEWLRETRSQGLPARPGGGRKLGAWLLASALALVAAWQVAVYDKPRHAPAPVAAERSFSQLSALLATGALPMETQSVFGTPLQPVNVLILARDHAHLASVLHAAGWREAAAPNLASLLKAARSALTGTGDINAPVTPYFWLNAPNALAFERATEGEPARRRHLVRVWPTPYTRTDGLRLYAGAASLDDRQKWFLLHHIAPDIDAERDTLRADLEQTGRADVEGMVQTSPPKLGTSAAGDPWLTDGKAVILRLR